MRKRFLAGLLAAGMVLQSFSMPVFAAGKEQEVVSSESAADLDEGGDIEETSSVSEEASENPEPASDEVSESSSPAQTEAENEETESSEEEAGTAEISEEETDASRTPETEDFSVLPDLKDEEDSLQGTETQPENSEPEIGYVDGGEGVYQEGSFTVDGEEAEDAYGISLYTENDFSKAEAYLYGQLQKKEETIDISEYGIPVSMVGALVHGVLNEHPDLYYVNGGFRYSYGAGSIVQCIFITYSDGFDDAAFDQAVKEALSVVKDGMTDLEKAIALHEYIVLNCEYDYENYLNNNLPSTVYSAYGVMVNRSAVCQGYALAYKMLLNMSGIECYMVSSSAMNHAWNLIKLDGQYYQVDTTWDDPVWDKFGLVHHSYMFVSDEAFSTESDVRGEHHDWVITKGSETVNLTAEDSKYDNVFWTGSSSPLIWSEHNYYYIDSSSKSICMRSSIDAAPSTLVSNIGTWTTPSGGYWLGAFSGLSMIEGRLYYNTPYKICSVSVEGGDVREETDDLNSSGQYVYSSAFCQGKMQYVLHEGPDYSGKETILTANLKNVTIKGIAFELDEVDLVPGESVILKPVLVPSYADDSRINWTASDENVASVSKGVVTAVSKGNCIITAEADGETATCNVTVDDSEYQVTFIGWNNEVVKTETVKAGKPATPPDDLTIPEGYELKGWKGDYSSISQNTTIEALIEPIVYIITYQLDGGVNAAGNPADYTIETQDIILQPAGGREGYLFVGWYSDEKYKNKVETIKKGSKGNITLYARWKDERGLWLKAEGSNTENFIPDEPYTGKAVKPAVEVYYGSTPLKAGTDYTISYKNNTAANLLRTDEEKGKAPAVVIKGKGNFAGTLTCTFVITPKSIAPINEEELKGGEVQADNLAAAYNKGRAVKPVPVLVWNGKKLSNKKDFTVEYPDEGTNADAYKVPGSYKVRVTGKGNFTGTREIMLTIADPANDVLLGKVKISKIPEQPYTGSAAVFGQDMPKLTYAGEELKLNVDYNLSFAAGDDGTSAGSHVLVINGMGKYKGVCRVNFKIKGTPVNTVTVNGLKPLVYNGTEQIFGGNSGNNLTLTDKDGSTLAEGRDYTLSFSNNKNAGTAKVTITGTGKYSGKLTKTFKITAYSVAEGSPGIEAVFENNSTEQPFEKGGAKPKVKVTFRGMELEEGTDYTLSYKNNTFVDPQAGKTPTVTIKGKKNFTGSRQLVFTIKAKELDDGISIMAPDLE
ncbi:MAG: InlB B-repeat-containing protein, partial [Lachnospiraceae bacterium]|nr:InlB B-repeat-containing protein [Lachnospiraceae bacterium]